MKPATSLPLKLLISTRELRRESAIGKLAEARRVLEEAASALRQAQHEAEQATQWREDILGQCALGKGGTLREALLPSCDALLSQRLDQVRQTHHAWTAAKQHFDLQRQHLTGCERDLLRLEEWLDLQKAQARRQQATQENQQDEDLGSPGQRSL